MSDAAVTIRSRKPFAWEDVKALVVDAVSSPHSKRAYARALEEFARWAKEEEAAGGQARSSQKRSSSATARASKKTASRLPRSTSS